MNSSTNNGVPPGEESNHSKLFVANSKAQSQLPSVYYDNQRLCKYQ